MTGMGRLCLKNSFSAMFHRIAIWRVFVTLDFSTFQRNRAKPEGN